MPRKTDRRVTPETVKLLGVPFGTTGANHYFRIVPTGSGYEVQRRPYDGFGEWETHPRNDGLTSDLDETLLVAARQGLFLVDEEAPAP